MFQKPLSTENEMTAAALYPELTIEQRKEAEYYLLRYLATVQRIFERVARENPKLLLELEKRAKLRKEKTARI